MQTATPAFATAVVSADQTIAYSVVVTLSQAVSALAPTTYGDLTDCVKSIDGFYRQITTQTPDTTTLISGTPSAQPQITFAGPLKQGDGVMPDLTKTVYWLFNPYDPTSPMFRQSRTGLQIVFKMGLYDGQTAPELITVFTGTIDQIMCNVDGSVTMTLLDRRNTVTNQAALPPVITFAPYNSGLTSEYAVDYLFRYASPSQYYSWPKIRPNCVVAAGMRSSIWPEVGTYSTTTTQNHTFAPGIWGTALSHTDFINVYETAAPMLPSQVNYFEAYVQGKGAGNFSVSIGNHSATPYELWMLWLGDGNIYLFTISPSGQSAATAVTVGTVGQAYVGFQMSWPAGSTTVTGTFTIGVTTFPVTLTALDARPSNVNFTEVGIGAGTGTIEGVQVCNAAGPFNLGALAFRPTLLIDPGGSLNPLTALPDVTGQDSWSVLQQIAQAEAAVIGFNEVGKAFFTNRETIQTAAVARTITSTTSLKTLASLEQQSLVATHVQIPVNQIQITVPQTVWSASTVLSVSPAEPLVFTATPEDPVVAVALTDSGFYPNSGAVPGLTYWQGCFSADGLGAPVIVGISVSIVQLSASQLQVTVTNTTGSVVYLVTPTGGYQGTVGNPSLVIGGQAISPVTAGPDGSTAGGTIIADSQWPPSGSGGAISNRIFGEVLLSFSSDSWVQDLPSAQALADYYIEDLSWPKPMVRQVAIIPDPRLQCLDRVTLIDTDVSQMSADALVIGIDMSLSNGRFSQSLDARMWARPGAWLLGVLGSSELSLTTWIY